MVTTDVSTLNARLAAFLLAAIAATPSFGALDEALLGKDEGYPVCPLTQGPTEPRCLVGTISHFDQVVPARKVAKASAPRVLKRAAKEPVISYTFGEAYTFREQPGIRPTERMFALLGVRGQAVMVDPKSKVVVVHTAVHGRPANDPLRDDQYALFFGAVNSLK